MKEIKTVPKPTYATVTGHNLPDKHLAQNTTSNPVNNQSTSKGHQEKAKKERLTQAKYPIAEREIVISFKNGLKCEPTDENAFRALKTVNKAIAENKDLERPPFIRARFTLSNNASQQKMVEIPITWGPNFWNTGGNTSRTSPVVVPES
jgi:hypothetical protein